MNSKNPIGRIKTIIRMNHQQLLNEVLAVLHTVKDDKAKLEKIHQFMLSEIYEEPEEEQIPEKYKKIVAEIADALTAGLYCFLNPETLEWEDIPETFLDDTLETGLDEEDMIPIKHTEWNRCIALEPMHSSEAFQIMADFTEEIDDQQLKDQLINALNKRKPFANFKWIIDNSDYRQNWFEFRQKQYENHVWHEIELELEENDTLESSQG